LPSQGKGRNRELFLPFIFCEKENEPSETGAEQQLGKSLPVNKGRDLVTCLLDDVVEMRCLNRFPPPRNSEARFLAKKPNEVEILCLLT
jgi:hypothetical protein